MAIQQTAGNITKKTVRIPLSGNNQQRDTISDKDQRIINYVFETSTNTTTGAKKLFVVKRPGTVLHSSPSAVAAEGRGCWNFNGGVWSVFGSTLYNGTTAKATLSTSTGICGATEFVNNADYGKAGLFIADGIDAWTVDSTNTVRQVDIRYLQWAAATIIEAGDRRVPTTIGNFWYVAITSGTTGTSEPVWPVIVGNTVVDGGVTWRNEGTYNGPLEWTNATAVAVGAEVIPTTESGFWYTCVDAGTTGALEPVSWPLIIGDTVADGTAVWECSGEYGGFPTPHVPTPVFLDGYVFLPDEDSVDIYNSAVSTPYSWSALDFASAEAYPDPIIGLARQNNFVVAFGTQSTEFFYNYARASQLTSFDSPIDRFESFVVQTGALSSNALLQAERSLLFVGDSQIGGYAIWRIDGSNATEISTEYIEKFIDLESPTSGVTGYGMRVMGHMLFVLNLPTANKTFVYDLEENMWSEWQYNGGMMPFIYFADANGTLLLQHKTNGKIYKFDPLTYQDFDASITCRIRLAKQDFETDSFKFYHQITIIGDKPTSTDIVRWSDDDYTTWSSDYTLPATDRPYFMRTGKARRRAWELEYTHNSARRLEAFEITYSIGNH